MGMIQWMLFVVLSLTGALFLLVALFIMRSIQRRRRNEEIIQYTDIHFDGWFDYIFHGIGTPPPIRNDAHVEAVEKIFFSFSNNGYSEGIYERIEAFSTENFTHRYEHTLKHRPWAQRINTLNKIIEFRMGGFEDVFTEKEIQRLSRFEYFLFLIYLSLFDMDRFMYVYFLRDDLSEYEYKKIFSRLDDEQVTFMRGRFEEMTTPSQLALIGRVSFIRDSKSLDWLETMFASDVPEVRIRTLKAISAIGSTRNQDVYMAFYESEVWEERMLAIRLAPTIGDASVYGVIKGLDDPHPLVRREAVKTLSDFMPPMTDWAVPLPIIGKERNER
ncbi:HEAT repeat domain-containing protein [Salinicoccus roseus]|uniref:HEAT repeat domain-containing protein n=1 Tax=Salinicoccus roseus TaxID=45670 RepID=UPI002301CD61|nr:HEAT repeat domain-containing protein [Salinicoccus roseus]